MVGQDQILATTQNTYIHHCSKESIPIRLYKTAVSSTEGVENDHLLRIQCLQFPFHYTRIRADEPLHAGGGKAPCSSVLLRQRHEGGYGFWLQKGVRVAEVGASRAHSDLHPNEVKGTPFRQKPIDLPLERRLRSEEQPDRRHQRELRIKGPKESLRVVQFRAGESVNESCGDQTGVVTPRLEQTVRVVVVGGDDEIGRGNQGIHQFGLQRLERGLAAGPADSPLGEAGIDGGICVGGWMKGYR